MRRAINKAVYARIISIHCTRKRKWRARNIKSLERAQVIGVLGSGVKSNYQPQVLRTRRKKQNKTSFRFRDPAIFRMYAVCESINCVYVTFLLCRSISHNVGEQLFVYPSLVTNSLLYTRELLVHFVGFRFNCEFVLCVLIQIIENQRRMQNIICMIRARARGYLIPRANRIYRGKIALL